MKLHASVQSYVFAFFFLVYHMSVLEGGLQQDWECVLGWTRELDRCVACLPGTEGVQVQVSGDDRHACQQCARGKFKTGEPENPCVPCPTGTYSANVGASGCTACPDKQTTQSANSVSIDACTCGASRRTPVSAPALSAENRSAVEFYATSGGLGYCLYKTCDVTIGG